MYLELILEESTEVLFQLKWMSHRFGKCPPSRLASSPQVQHFALTFEEPQLVQNWAQRLDLARIYDLLDRVRLAG